MRTVDWHAGGVRLIDQRLLPNRLETPVYHDYVEVAKAITDMVVRGAPAIGATAAFGLALAAFQSAAKDRLGLLRDLEKAAAVLRHARPTAVNLNWALMRLLRVAADESLESADDVRNALLAEAQRLADEDVEINRRMGYNGAALINDGDVILHHCNTGALAAVDFGTALGVVFAASVAVACSNSCSRPASSVPRGSSPARTRTRRTWWSRSPRGSSTRTCAS